MKLLGILRASALCLLAIGFHGQPVSCGIFNILKKAKKDSNAKVSEISENHQESNVESSSQESLPSSQSDLVFESSTWDDSHLASSVLFLDKFCRNVSAKKFKEQVTNKKLYGDIKAVCRGCMVRLNFLSRYFIPKYGPGSVAERNEIPMDLYENALKPEDFDVYVRWLAENIPGIWKSYKQMLEESLKYPSKQLKTDNTAGPLKYGFLYKGGWWNPIAAWSEIDDESPLTLLVTLEKLQHCLKRVLKSYPRRSSVVPSVVEEAEDSTVKSQDAVPEKERKEPHGFSDFSNEFNSEHDGKWPH
ncbi:secreted antigen 1 [Babesia divergens]|uniref:Secreted antigen 1 n=1 Tax=Babesia divergens TaxID=32595 RepID=A0AAD9LEA3_BABDI|nr:secreted antigen 1 [Babesia divergens]